MRRLSAVSVVVLLAGCGMHDTGSPVPQADTPIFGRIAEIREVAGSPGTWDVDVKAGLPESLQAVMRQQGRLIPEMEKDLLERIRVTPDTVCVTDALPTDLDAFRAGQEVATVPVPGTVTLTGTKLLQAEAAEFYQFSSYELRFLPRAVAALPAEVTSRSDPARINSSGLERTPIPLRGGRVVYFAAGLLPPAPVGKSDQPRGAVRPGMRDPSGALAPWTQGGFRPYRVEFGKTGWKEPLPVALPGLPPAASARITWVNEEETDCLVEVDQRGKPAELLASHRANAQAPWGALEKVKEAVGDSVGDGQRFAVKGGSALVWTVYQGDASDLWLAMPGKAGGPLEPRINTMGPEWAPRIGPNTTLYFCRADRQLLFANHVVQEVRLPGKQRRPLLEATTTADGALLFFRAPRYSAGDLDWDLAVAPRAGAGWGRPVLLDDWKP